VFVGLQKIAAVNVVQFAMQVNPEKWGEIKKGTKWFL
jgi:hypothetical protein